MKNIARFAQCLLATLAISSVAGAQESARQFMVGDRILLEVQGDTALSDTFPVQPGPSIKLPMIGSIPLSGVRRSEVEPYLIDRLGRYLKNPIIHARALVRISIEGEVEHPGSYAVPTDVVLGDVLMSAGGLTKEAKMSGLKIDRAGQEVLEGGKLQYALAQGRTVDELGLRAGDRIVVPRMGRSDTESKVRIIAGLIAIPVGIYTLTRLIP